MLETKFPLGSRAGGIMTDGEVPLRVLGYHGEGVIVEVLADYPEQGGGLRHAKGDVFVAAQINLTQREEVKYIPGEAEDDNGAAISWLELGGLSAGLTRSRDGSLLVSLEKSPDVKSEDPIRVRIIPAANDTVDNTIWEGEIK